MTDEEYQAALVVIRPQVKAYVADIDSTRSLRAIQILICTMINNAGSLENLTAILAVLQANLG